VQWKSGKVAKMGCLGVPNFNGESPLPNFGPHL